MKKLMKKFVLVGLGLAIAVSASSCGHKKVKLDPSKSSASSEADGKGVTLDILWIKPKGDSLDINLRVHNNYSHAVYFTKGCLKGEFAGQPLETSSYDFTYELPAGATETDIIVFKSQSKLSKTGSGSVTLDPITGEPEGTKASGKQKKLPAVKLPFDLE